MSQTINYFKEICKYPRPSKKEEKIRDFLINFFSSKGYNYKLDNQGNLVVYVPAKNTNSTEVVMLQSHMDMVCVKTSDNNHNFETDSIQIIEKDGIICAKNTTLGADNGIGIALCMGSIFFEKHPELELVFTTNEEAGMSGVLGLDFSLLKSTKIINLDFEDDDQICIGSAGGIRFTSNKNLFYTKGILPTYEIELYGMKGGHSGCEIHKNRGNMIKIIIDFLSNYKENFEVYNINSGYADNVISSKLNMILGINDLEDFKISLNNYILETKAKYDCPDLSFNINKINTSLDSIKNIFEILKDLSKVQDGIIKMNENISDLVQTSINIGIIKIENETIFTSYLLRSSVNSELIEHYEFINKYLTQKGFTVFLNAQTPGWQDDINSNLLNIAKTEFETILGFTPKILIIHAGLECGALVSGLVKQNNKNVNAISIGPNIRNAHSINEYVEINSIIKLENILKGILEKLS